MSRRRKTIVLLVVYYGHWTLATLPLSPPVGSTIYPCGCACFLLNHHSSTRRIISKSRSNNCQTYPTTIEIAPSIHKELHPSHYCNISLSASRSKITDQTIKQSLVRPKKKKRATDGSGTKSNNGRRMKKSDIDDLVRGIGLEPVPTRQSPAKNKKATSIDTTNSQQIMHDDKNEQQNVNIIPQSSPVISLQTQLDYCRQGHAVLRSFLPQNLIQKLRSELLPHAASHAMSAWRQKVEVQLADSPDDYCRENARSIATNLNSVEECQEILESFGLDPLSGDLPFLQHFNTWRAPFVANNDPNNITPTAVRTLCLSPYLAQTASILLDTSTIRLYQDSLFHKRVGDGWTPWHSDARMAPFDTSKMITFWIPLQKVPAPEDGGTGLLFADGSHADFALPYWNGAEGNEYERLENRYGGDGGASHHMPLELGDVTVHNGWTLHCADAADCMEDGDRYAFSITFVDGHSELRDGVILSERDATNGSALGDNEDVWSYRSWVEEVKPRTQFRHPLVPIVWPPDERDI